MDADVEKFFHPNFRYKITTVGSEGQKVIVVDNFVNDPDSLIEHATRQSAVTMATGLYPGFRSPAPQMYGAVVRAVLTEVICEAFALTPSDISETDSSYSMVATPRAKLSAYQQIPHFDKPRPDEIALLHYLCGPEQGGTSFYRHRSTGYEYVDQNRVENYKKVIAGEIERVGLPQPPTYINGDTALFERIGSVEARFNRCLIYRCSTLHSGDISSNYAFDLNPWTGRFTITSFLYGKGHAA